MTHAQRDAARARLDELAVELLALPDVDWGRMFGTSGLRVRSKVFAVVVQTGGLMVKLPAARVDELVEAGTATRMVMAGSPRREWAVVPNDADDEVWAELLDESHAYVDEITPPTGQDDETPTRP